MPTFASYVMLPGLVLVYADGGIWVFYLCADVESWRVFTSRCRVFAYSCIASSFINVFLRWAVCVSQGASLFVSLLPGSCLLRCCFRCCLRGCRCCRSRCLLCGDRCCDGSCRRCVFCFFLVLLLHSLLLLSAVVLFLITAIAPAAGGEPRSGRRAGLVLRAPFVFTPF